MSSNVEEKNDQGRGNNVPSNDSVPTTYKKFIMQLAKSCTTHLRCQPCTRGNALASELLSNLESYNFLFALARENEKNSFMNDVDKLIETTLKNHNINAVELGGPSILYLKTTLQTIVEIFKDKVFNS